MRTPVKESERDASDEGAYTVIVRWMQRMPSLWLWIIVVSALTASTVLNALSARGFVLGFLLVAIASYALWAIAGRAQSEVSRAADQWVSLPWRIVRPTTAVLGALAALIGAILIFGELIANIAVGGG